MTNNQWNWKKWLNGVVVVPEDTRDWVKYGTAIVIALLNKYGYNELGGLELFMIGFVVKAIADRIHHWLKYGQV